jgi:hypothetical protein
MGFKFDKLRAMKPVRVNWKQSPAGGQPCLGARGGWRASG